MIQFDERVWVAGSLDENELRALKAAGVALLIDLRDDGEPAPRGLDPDDEARLAAAVDLPRRRVAIAVDHSCRTRFEEVGRLVEATDAPVLVHCASGRRAAVVLVANEGRRCGWSPDECAQRVRGLGFDLENMPFLRDALADYVSREAESPAAAGAGAGI
jgi:uncharacterized protein (TIGR01244 family)